MEEKCIMNFSGKDNEKRNLRLSCEVKSHPTAVLHHVTLVPHNLNGPLLTRSLSCNDILEAATTLPLNCL